jgi:hypothetical protein
LDNPTMTDATDTVAPGPLERRLRYEAILAGVLLLIGFAVLPACVYFVGQQILGDYGGGLGAFYGDLYAALGRGEAGAWILLGSPLIGIELLRLLVIPLRRRRARGLPEGHAAEV